MKTLLEAVKNGDEGLVVERLRTGGSNLDRLELVRALKSAAFDGKHRIARLLLEFGVSVNSQEDGGMSAFDCAVEQQDDQMVLLCIEFGANVNQQDEFGQSPLHRAVDIEAESAIRHYEESGEVSEPESKISSLLLEYGANPRLTTSAGESPLDWAIRSNHKRAVRLLSK